MHFYLYASKNNANILIVIIRQQYNIAIEFPPMDELYGFQLDVQAQSSRRMDLVLLEELSEFLIFPPGAKVGELSDEGKKRAEDIMIVEELEEYSQSIILKDDQQSVIGESSLSESQETYIDRIVDNDCICLGSVRNGNNKQNVTDNQDLTSLQWLTTDVPSGTAWLSTSHGSRIAPAPPPSSGFRPPKSPQPVQLNLADYQTNGEKKPPLSYRNLIYLAMKYNGNKITLDSIYQWISTNFKYYRQPDDNWKGYIRHNLTINKGFIKCPRSRGEPGKGGYWQLDPAYFNKFEEKLRKCLVSRRDIQRERKRQGTQHLAPNPNHYESTSLTPCPSGCLCQPPVLISRVSGSHSQPHVLTSWASGRQPQLPVLTSCASGSHSQPPVLISWASGSQCQPTALMSWASGSQCQPPALMSWASGSQCQPPALMSWASGSQCQPPVLTQLQRSVLTPCASGGQSHSPVPIPCASGIQRQPPVLTTWASGSQSQRSVLTSRQPQQSFLTPCYASRSQSHSPPLTQRFSSNQPQSLYPPNRSAWISSEPIFPEERMETSGRYTTDRVIPEQMFQPTLTLQNTNQPDQLSVAESIIEQNDMLPLNRPQLSCDPEDEGIFQIDDALLLLDEETVASRECPSNPSYAGPSDVLARSVEDILHPSIEGDLNNVKPDEFTFVEPDHDVTDWDNIAIDFSSLKDFLFS